MGMEAVRFLVLWMAGWVNSRQLEVIDFLREENRVLREQIGRRQLRFTDEQRWRLAAKERIVGRRRLGEFAGLVTPGTILRWYRELVARNYDGSARRRPGRPTVVTTCPSFSQASPFRARSAARATRHCSPPRQGLRPRRSPVRRGGELDQREQLAGAQPRGAAVIVELEVGGRAAPRGGENAGDGTWGVRPRRSTRANGRVEDLCDRARASSGSRIHYLQDINIRMLVDSS
ncbi:MAG TPA: hypothetical protein VHT91_04460 [Kofleriaceae bacterium]|jgi:hypothetical protein|nr:hypothetical protein [Kofleriaceae bacterium]